MRGGGCLWPVDDDHLCARDVVGDHKVCSHHLPMIYPGPGYEEEAAANMEIINDIIRQQNGTETNESN